MNASSPLCRTANRICAAPARRNGAAGQYDGRIHIAWTDGAEVGPQMQRALAHELVHACLTSIPSGPRPGPHGCKEGLAQKLSGDTLPPSIREQLRQLAAAHTIPGSKSRTGLVPPDQAERRLRL